MKVALVSSRHSNDLTLSLASEEVSIPYCSAGSAQLCYHGHRQAVRFIISAPGKSWLLRF